MVRVCAQLPFESRRWRFVVTGLITNQCCLKWKWFWMPLNMRNYTIHCKFISWFCRWYREKMRELRVRSQKAPKKYTRPKPVFIFQVTSISGWPGPWEPTALQSPQASAQHRRIPRCWTHRRRRGPSDGSWGCTVRLGSKWGWGVLGGSSQLVTS